MFVVSRTNFNLNLCSNAWRAFQFIFRCRRQEAGGGVWEGVKVWGSFGLERPSLRNFSYLFASARTRGGEEVAEGATRKKFSHLCVSRRKASASVLRNSSIFSCLKWQSKLWFTISIEDYMEWTIKARGQHNNSETFSLRQKNENEALLEKNKCF